MQHVQWTIGVGKSILFWQEKLIDGVPNLSSMNSFELDQFCDFVDESGQWKNIDDFHGIPEKVKTAWEKGLKKVIIESDSTKTIAQIRGINLNDGTEHPIFVKLENSSGEIGLCKSSTTPDL
ncbi:uncharacterized protein G2W53_015416 [Senna tora]|uniref:Uncharacterized protein n=1 Tax=Senna tora TaxID=362788 RepID=A0A834WW22_9FABA|nr:uncharacterized protein G2W53_015416 [Senna tora]